MILTYVICIIYNDLKHKIGNANSIWKNEGLKRLSNSLYIISLTFQDSNNVRYTWTRAIFVLRLNNLKHIDESKKGMTTLTTFETNTPEFPSPDNEFSSKNENQQTTCFNSKASYQLIIDPFCTWQSEIVEKLMFYKSKWRIFY